MKYAIVQLCSYGDICNLLPIAHELHKMGHEVHWFHSAFYRSIFEAVSYVHPHSYTLWHDTANFLAMEKIVAGMGFDNILMTDNDLPEHPTDRPIRGNFATQQWARAGAEWEPLYDELPLIFDRRDREGEKEAIERCIPEGDRPVLAYCLTGRTSPLARIDEFKAWLHEEFSGQFRLANIGLDGGRCKRVHHLLGPIEKADALLTIDTVTLHLSHATGTPTIALQPNPPSFLRSPRRKHWLGSMSYAEAMTEKGRGVIRDCLSRIPVLI